MAATIYFIHLTKSPILRGISVRGILGSMLFPDGYSPMYDVLKSHGAVYGSKFGWERPNWFSTTGNTEDIPTFGYPMWWEAVCLDFAPGH